MTPSFLPQNHPDVLSPKEGILLINLGTPSGTSWREIRNYLKEFLSDRRVIEMSPFLWQPILHLFILTLRPHKTAHAYKSIWRLDSNESPLRYFTRRQSENLTQALENTDSHLKVSWAMRYGAPSIASQIAKLKEQGCTRLTVLPLYPQYCAATTATVCDEVFRVLSKMRWQPAVKIIPPFHDHPTYIRALAQSVQNHYKTLDWQPEKLLASFHGMPQESRTKGDPYACHCDKTARLLSQELHLDTNTFERTFQSRFGPKAWLQPYTEEVLKALPGQGISKIAVIAPGFVSDCVETLEEINIRYRAVFMEAGGTHFTMVPCLNDSPAFTHLLMDLLAVPLHTNIQQEKTSLQRA